MVKDNFSKVMGHPAKAKVFGFMMKEPQTDHSISQIAKGSHIGRTTLFRVWKSLIDSHMLIKTRVIGNAKMYKLDFANPIVEKLDEIHKILEESASKRKLK